LEVGRSITITPTGMIGSLRQKNDGLPKMGSLYMNEGEVVNDLIIPDAELGIGKQNLIIKFNSDSRTYLIKDLGEGTGTFVRIDKPITLKSRYKISFGDSHMRLSPHHAENIAVKFLDGPKSDEQFEFSADESPIRIGRMADCRVRFEDNSLSRYQCELKYSANEGWALSDGDGTKKSTNGTWLFVDDYFPLSDTVIFKAGQALFRAILQTSSDLTT